MIRGGGLVMEENYFNLKIWEKWADNIYESLEDICKNKTIAFNISGFNEFIVLLRKNEDSVSFALNQDIDVITAADAEILIEIKAMDFNDILSDGLDVLRDLLIKSRAMMFLLVSPEQLYYDGFSKFLRNIGFKICKNKIIPLYT